MATAHAKILGLYPRDVSLTLTGDFMRKYTQDNEARRRAREVIGMPSKTRVIPDKRRKREKHKKNVLQLQRDES